MSARLMVEATPSGPRGPGLKQWIARASVGDSIVHEYEGKDEATALRFLAYKLLEDLAKRDYWGTSLDE